MKAKKLPSGSWRCQAYVGERNGKKMRKSFTAPTKKEAEFLANQYIHEMDAYFSDNCTVADAIDRYITARESVLSPSTIKGYRRSQEKDFASINHFSVQVLSSEHIQRFINEISVGRSPKTVKNIWGLLRAALKAVNPTRSYFVTLPQSEQIEYSIPTDEDVKNMLNIADPEMKKAIILAAVGTMRRGEISAVEYSDLKGNVLHVHSDMVITPENTYVIKPVPKTSASDRYISFSDSVINQLGDGKGRIVNLDPMQISHRFKTIKKKAGVNCRFHDLRHYAASIMHAIGVPDQYIMERGGWSSDSVLKSVYRNTLSDKSKEFSDKTNSYLDKFF